ncbi:MAG: UDP-N-acetylglucosamine 2-epimerase, partial [Phycisphaeraceae bacterium]
GVADEAMRHAITKLAHLHLPATAQSRRRILRMGEPAQTVHRVGSPAIDALRSVEPAADAPELIVLHHPVGDEDETEGRRMRAILDATAGRSRIVLHPNHDPGRAGIMHALRSADVQSVEHLPRTRFLSLLKGAKAIVGNSSAGLIEAAALRTPCVNLGQRQAGREAPGHVVHCNDDADPAAIAAAIDRALQLDPRRLRHPYGRGDTGARVAELLANLPLTDLPLRKRNTY